MGRAKIRIFGVNFVAPKGLRKSPGRTPFNSCISMKLAGKTGGGKAGQKARFAAAAKECKR